MDFAAAGAEGAEGAEGVVAGLDAESDLVSAGLAVVADSALLLSEGTGTDVPAAGSPESVLASVGNALFFPAPSLKSVTYQPVPLS